MKSMLGAVVLLAGCAQVLGLDKTKLGETDAATDAPGVCDGEPAACVSSTGRSACGQVFSTGGAPLRVAAPTGEACVAGNVEGPCALQVAGLPAQSLFDGVATGELAGTIDDCGRFVVPDLDSTVIDVAVTFKALSGFHPSARLVLNRPAEVGEDRGLAAFVVLQATTVEWATQLALPPDDTTTGFLVRYTSTNLTPVVGEAVAIDSGSPLTNPPGTIPWAAYFGAEPFGILDPAAMVTGASGTAFAAMPAGPFSLEGFRQGRRCKLENLRSVGNLLIHVVEEGC